MRTRRFGALLLGACFLAGCSRAVEEASDVADTVAEKTVAQLAVGRWTCETDQVESRYPKHITTWVAIAPDGRFSYEVQGEGPGPLTGTWRIEGLQVQASIPWQSEGRNGFDNWVFLADADPPTHVDGQSARGAVQDLDIGFDGDRLTIHQEDDGGEIGGVGYAWDVTCERTSDDPGEIAPTIPATSSGD